MGATSSVREAQDEPHRTQYDGDVLPEAHARGGGLLRRGDGRPVVVEPGLPQDVGRAASVDDGAGRHRGSGEGGLEGVDVVEIEVARVVVGVSGRGWVGGGPLVGGRGGEGGERGRVGKVDRGRAGGAAGAER